jgi:hypothetical protein
VTLKHPVSLELIPDNIVKGWAKIRIGEREICHEPIISDADLRKWLIRFETLAAAMNYLRAASLKKRLTGKPKARRK